MRRTVIALGCIVVLGSCAHTQPPGRMTSRSVPQQSSGVPSVDVAETLLALSQEWVDTWNQRDVERMAQLHGDAAHTVYLIGDSISTVEWLLQEIRETKFWNLSWKLTVVDPHVRILGPESGLVSFRLVGEEVGAGGTRPFSAAFSLVYQKLDEGWKIVHVQDSSRLDEPASPGADGEP